MKDVIPMSKLKLKLSNEAKKTFPFVERRNGGKIHFSLEKDDEIKTRPGEPTGKFISKERYNHVLRGEILVNPPEFSDKKPQMPNIISI